MKHYSPHRLAGVLGFFTIALLLFFTTTASAAKQPTQNENKFNSISYLFDPDRAELDIIKEALTPSIVAGETAEFEITISNIGEIPLVDIEVVDPQVPACTKTFTEIAPNSSEIYTCSLAEVYEPLTNTVAVTGTHGAINTIMLTDSDSASVEVEPEAPTVAGIDIEKTALTPFILSGGTAEFEITVTNTGDDALVDVSVSDALVPNCDNFFLLIGAGNSETYTCSLENVTADFTNSATASGTVLLDTTVNATDTADVVIVHPEISIEKTTSTPSISVGGTAIFEITVKNEGDVPLSNIVVTDNDAPNCDKTFSTLGIDDEETYTCSLGNVTSGFTNIAEVTAEDAYGNEVDDSDSAVVFVNQPSIDIVKTAVTEVIDAGQAAIFEITVRNTGNTALYNVIVSDQLAPVCENNNIGTLAVSEVISYQCTVTGLTNNFTNTATVTAQDGLGTNRSDSSSDTVSVRNPGVSISVSPASQTIDQGNAATFSVTVTNIGNRQLRNVEVVSNVSNCEKSINVLNVGQSDNYTCAASNVQNGFINELTVNAIGSGQALSDSTSAIVDVEETSDIVVAVSPNLQTIPAGATANFTIFLFNNSNKTLNNLAVSSPAAPDCDFTLSSMPPQFTVDYTCKVTNVQSSFTNSLNVTATPEGSSTPIEDNGLAIVNLVGIDLTVTPNSTQLGSPGGNVTFNATIKNVGGSGIHLSTLSGSITKGQTDPQTVSLINNSCQTGTFIQSGGQYNCSFEVDVSGVSGNYKVEIEASAEDDGLTVFDTAVKTIKINPPPITNVYVPTIKTSTIPGEPNNSCAQAHPITVNTLYKFFPDDQIDLYTFNLTSTSNLSVTLTDFTPIKGQIVLFYGDCDAPPVTIANNGNSSSTKTLTLQNQPAGTYILMVVTDGTYSSTKSYKLIVNK